jgi:chromosome segregation ATPase
MEGAASTFHRLVNADSIAAMESELDVDRARFDELFNNYSRLRAEMESLQESIKHQETVIEALRSALPASRTRGAQRGSRTDMTKREIATEILRGSIQPLFPREVREIARERGWISGDQAAANQLSVAMAKAARSGAFVRDRDGRYSLSKQK